MFKKLLTAFLLLIFYHNVNATKYYVSTAGRDSNNGLSLNRPFKTLNRALKKAKAGDVIWVKAGNYGREYVSFPKNGIKSKPITVIGYRYKPGDIKSSYYKYSKGKALDVRQMPTFDGRSRNTSKIGFVFYKTNNIVVKNIQIQNYGIAVSGIQSKNITFENLVIKNAGGSKYNGVGFRFSDVRNSNNVFKNSTVVNCSMTAYMVYGSNNLIYNCKSYTDEDDGKGRITMNYHVSITGSNNKVVKHHAEHVGNLSHTGHGIVLKSGNYRTENNKIEDCDIVNINGSIEFRHRKVKNNLAKNIRIKGKNSRYSGGIHFRDGASNNIVEGALIDGLKGKNGAISFYDTTEDGGTKLAAENNIVRNTIITNSTLGIRFGTISKSVRAHTIKNNKILNCVFYNVSSLIRNYPKAINTNNKIQNTIISGSKKYYYRNNYTKGWNETYNNYYGNAFKMPKGKGNIAVNPQFVSPSKKIFKLKKGSKIIDKGLKNSLVKRDFYGNLRHKGKSQDIGIFEYGGTIASSPITEPNPPNNNQNNDPRNNKLVANAGKDVRTCSGNRVVLTASGGNRFRWSTGQTTKSITIYPKTNLSQETFKYSVTVYEGNLSATDDVNVTVKSTPKLNLGKDILVRKGRTVTLSSNVNARWYKWSNGSKTKSIRVKPNRTTSYSLVVKGYNGCLKKDEIKLSVSSTKQSTTLESDDIKVYPNPTTNWINIVNSNNRSLSYKLVDSYNKTIKSGTISKNKKVSMAKLKKGIYFLRVFDKNDIVVKKIIRN